MSNFVVGEGPQRNPGRTCWQSVTNFLCCFHKKTKQWETPQLSAEEKYMISGVIDSIRRLERKVPPLLLVRNSKKKMQSLKSHQRSPCQKKWKRLDQYFRR